MVDTAADKLLKALQENWLTILQDGDGEAKNDEVMKDLAERVCKAEWQHYAFRENLKNAARLETMDEFEEALEETKRTQHNRFKAKESNRYQTFVKDLNHVSAQYAEGETEPNTSISDVYATSDNLNDIDPITKGPLMKPVRNRHCNHIYGKDSIIESIQNNGRIRCPIMGCGNKKRVDIDDLIEDEDYARKLRHQRTIQ